MLQLRDFPTYDEILAIEHAARRAQAVEVSRLVALAFGKLVALTRKMAGALSSAFDLPVTGGSPGGSGSSTTLTSIMKELGASLPDEVRIRYSEELATAIRVAPVLDIAFAAWESVVRVLAQAFRGIAQALRATARGLDVAARRLMPLP